MAGERDLAVLLASMAPALHPVPYGFATCARLPDGLAPFATIAEDEGLTVIAPLEALEAEGMAGDAFARITLNVHSDLAAVGLTAAFATALGDIGVSANVIAGYHHDHIFVAWEDRHRALAALEALSRNEQA